MIKLYKDQEVVVKDILKEIDNNNLIVRQASTGWGKTYVALAVAKKLREQGYNVVIATIKNDIVSQFYDSATEGMGLDPAVVIGMNNYISIESAKETLSELKIPNIKSKKAVLNILKEYENAGNSLIFAAEVELRNKDIIKNEIWMLIKMLCVPKNRENIPLLNSNNIVLTNTFYLAQYILRQQNRLTKNTIVIIDEFDRIKNSIDSLFQYSVSMHEIKILADYFKSIETNPAKAKLLTSLSNKAERVRSAGKLLHDLDDEVTLKKIKESVTTQFKERFIKKVLKNFDSTNPITIRMHYIMNLLKMKKEGSYSVKFSSIRKYPTIIFKKRIKRYTYDKFWTALLKDIKCTIGFGATISVRKKATSREKEIRAITGIALDNINISFKEVKEDAKNIVVKIPPENNPHFTFNNFDKNEKWIKYVAKVISKTYDIHKNALIMNTSRDSADLIYKAILKENVIPEQLITFNLAIKTNEIVREYKSKGGLFVAYTNIGTGTDIPISSMYITSLPFPPPSTNYGISNYDIMTRELLQWMGRVRSNTEEREIYILDSRIRNKKYQRLIDIIKEKYKKVEVFTEED